MTVYHAPEHRRSRIPGLVDSNAMMGYRAMGYVSLVHMDGADGVTTFLDELGKTWTVSGGAQIDTAQSVFGGASGYFDGDGDYITTPATTDFQFGSGDFTIDFWARIDGTQSSGQLFQMGGQSGATYPDIMIRSISKTQVNVEVWAGATRVVNITTPAFTEHVFHHIAFIRHGNDFYLSCDGVLSSPVSYSGAIDFDNSRPVMVGYQTDQPSNHFYQGWIDELRVCKGVALWTENFTPPTGPA